MSLETTVIFMDILMTFYRAFDSTGEGTDGLAQGAPHILFAGGSSMARGILMLSRMEKQPAAFLRERLMRMHQPSAYVEASQQSSH